MNCRPKPALCCSYQRAACSISLSASGRSQIGRLIVAGGYPPALLPRRSPAKRIRCSTERSRNVVLFISASSPRPDTRQTAIHVRSATPPRTADATSTPRLATLNEIEREAARPFGPLPNVAFRTVERMSRRKMQHSVAGATNSLARILDHIDHCHCPSAVSESIDRNAPRGARRTTHAHSPLCTMCRNSRGVPVPPDRHTRIPVLLSWWKRRII